MKLLRRFVEKPWGMDALPSPFPAQPVRTGEVWFEAPDGRPLPLMVKYLFTSERLSVQVHPDDAQARARGLSGGKEECWYVLDAAPDATIGIGTRQALNANQLREAALSGEIEHLLDWRPVKAGDFIPVRPGTIHAIGAGISLVEVQQNEDVTYRLYDYGRPRELHLDDGVAVSVAKPFPDGLHQSVPAGWSGTLIDGNFFALTMAHGTVPDLPGSGGIFAIPLTGEVMAGSDVIQPGECGYNPAGEAWRMSSNASALFARAKSEGS
jgi:mannose-6-phosphate isomerase